MKVKRMYQMSELEKAITLMVWSDVQNLPLYDCWRNYERKFTYENKPYNYKCKYRVEGNHLRLIEAKIEHAQVIIDLHH
jgi:hypothetical protein